MRVRIKRYVPNMFIWVDIPDSTPESFVMKTALETLKQEGKEFKGIILENEDLTGIDLSGIELHSIQFENVILNDAKFDGCKFTNTTIFESLLNNIDFSHTTWEFADLHNNTGDGINFHGSRINMFRSYWSILKNCRMNDILMEDSGFDGNQMENWCIIDSVFRTRSWANR